MPLKQNSIACLCALLLISVVGCSAIKAIDKTETKETSIAFGSCSKQDKKQKLWPAILSEQPDLWLWLGDNIYCDDCQGEELAEAYAIQKNNPDYQKLLLNSIVHGIWDDHDYGINDGGKNYPYKEESKKYFLEFMDLQGHASLQEHEGVYYSYLLNAGSHSIKVFLLDTRSFKDDLVKDTISSQRYIPCEDCTILGDAQWNWLNDQLHNSEADINIIASSVQVLAAEHDYEKWANYPKERSRLLSLIQDSNVKHPIILSGDRHLAEINKTEANDKVIYEITASGMTHSYKNASAQKEPNQYRISKLIGDKNYGLLKIDWTKEMPLIQCEIRGIENVLLERQILQY